jgi:hypothetical protein
MESTLNIWHLITHHEVKLQEHPKSGGVIAYAVDIPLLGATPGEGPMGRRRQRLYGLLKLNSFKQSGDALPVLEYRS